MNYKFKSFAEFADWMNANALIARAQKARDERRAQKRKVLTPHRAALALEALERIKLRKVLKANSAAVSHIAIANPIAKRAAKSMGSKTMTLKVRNWGVKAAHFN